MILNIYKDSFEYAGQNLKTLLKIGILSFFNFLIIPQFLVLGFQYRIINISVNGMIDGDDKLPEFNNFTAMLVDGIKIFVVEILYIIIPIVIMILGGFLGGYFNNIIISIIMILIGLILFVISLLYLFLAVPNMVANEGSFKKAFDFEKITEIIKMIGGGKYLGFCIGVALINFVISIVVAGILFFILIFCGIASAIFIPSGVLAFAIVWNIIYVAIVSFIVTPYLGFFTSRANGLIYGIGA